MSARRSAFGHRVPEEFVGETDAGKSAEFVLFNLTS
jgi:hypothetical protein